MNDLMVEISDILEEDEISETDVLQTFENWDSLTVLSLVAMLDANHGINITAQDVRQCTTVGDLLAFVTSQVGEGNG